MSRLNGASALLSTKSHQICLTGHRDQLRICWLLCILQHQDNSTEHLYACNVLKTMIFTSIVSPRIPTYNLLYTKFVTLIVTYFIPQQYIMHGIANESGSSCNGSRVTNLKGQSPCMLWGRPGRYHHSLKVYIELVTV